MTAVPTLINDRWELSLPPHRAVRPEWPVWEKERLAAMHDVIAAMAAQVAPDGPRDRPPVVYDIGAEEGDLPALWATWGARVVLFEPDHRVWPNMRAIWEANSLPPPIWSFAGFAGPETRQPDNGTRLSDYIGSPWPACATGDVIVDHGFLNLCERPDVPTVALDDLAVSFPVYAVPDVITIDVEGAELEVLHGARRVLGAARPVVFVSVHPDFMHDMYDRTPDDVHRFMADLGYDAELLAVDHEHHYKYTHPANQWPAP
jgi:FkbM family methyltransferase